MVLFNDHAVYFVGVHADPLQKRTRTSDGTSVCTVHSHRRTLSVLATQVALLMATA